AGAWTMGLLATTRHARALGRRRLHELLRPSDVKTRRYHGRQAVSKRGSANDRSHRECARKSFDECRRIVALGALSRWCSTRATSKPAEHSDQLLSERRAHRHGDGLARARSNEREGVA